MERTAGFIRPAMHSLVETLLGMVGDPELRDHLGRRARRLRSKRNSTWKPPSRNCSPSTASVRRSNKNSPASTRLGRRGAMRFLRLSTDLTRPATKFLPEASEVFACSSSV